MPDVGGPELIIILVVVLVLFGGSQLPKLAKGLGQAQREFKKGIEGDKDDHALSTPSTGPSAAPTSTSSSAAQPEPASSSASPPEPVRPDQLT